MNKGRGGKPQRPMHQVRIIGGSWKRTPLPVLDAEGLRPTPDRVRETLFNWLHHLLGGEWEQVRCVDLFAGTGALGFEAASRGAAEVLLVEHSPAAVHHLQTVAARLQASQVSVRRGDALQVARELAAGAAGAAGGRRFQLVFLDPPYHQEWIVKILPFCAQLLADGGLVYAEAERQLDPAQLAGWDIVRADKAGMVFYHLLQRNSDRENRA